MDMSHISTEVLTNILQLAMTSSDRFSTPEQRVAIMNELAKRKGD